MTNSKPRTHPTDMALPTALLALDSTAALARLGNHTKLYLQVAKDYQTELIGLPARAQTLLQNDPKAALRMLHSFRGMSLTLGANQVADVCRQCVQALTADTPADTPAHIPAATRQHLLAVIQQVAQATLPVLQQTLDQLGHQLDAGGAAKPAQALLLKVQRGLIPQLRTIHTLLLRSDMQALEMYDALCLRHAGLEHSWQALDKAIKAFDFRQAALECSTLLQRMGDR